MADFRTAWVTNSKDIRLKKISLKKQMILFFLLICIAPIIIGSLFLIVRYSKSLQADAIHEILSKEKAALLIFHEYEKEIKNLALAYARQKTVSFLIPFDLGPKIGQELSRLAKVDHVDQVIVINDRDEVIARSRFPDRIKNKLAHRFYFDMARSGQAVGFTEILSPDELQREGFFDSSDLTTGESVISLTGVAPIKETDSEKIIGVILVRRFVRQDSALIQHISRSLEVHAGLYRSDRIAVFSILPDRSHSFRSPEPELLQTVLETNQQAQQFRFARGGYISIFSPIQDYQNHAAAVLMLQSDVRSYIRAWDMAILGLIGVLLAAIAMAWIIFTFIDTRFFQPIQKLKQLTGQIARGQKSEILNITSNDEIGELTSAFNHMAMQLALTHESLEAEIQEKLKSESALKQAYDELEIRILERTRNLSETNMSLHQEIQERRAAEEQVNASLIEKDLLLKEIHHRVKNNLQIVSSLLDMSQTRSHIPVVSEILASARSKIHTMALIHTQLYQSNRFDLIDMESHIHSLCQSLSQMFGMNRRVNLEIDARDMVLPIPQAIPCALVLNELISNSFKHAFKDAAIGNIWIQMEKKADSIHMEVRDDGIGISKDLSVMTITSLGIKLIRNLVLRQLKGKLSITRNCGTEVKIIFPIQIAEDLVLTLKEKV